MEADGLLDKSREVALLHAVRAEKGAQGEICLPRDLDVPADSFFLSHISIHSRQINTYTLIQPETAQCL
jgi:hypothetical protein